MSEERSPHPGASTASSSGCSDDGAPRPGTRGRPRGTLRCRAEAWTRGRRTAARRPVTALLRDEEILVLAPPTPASAIDRVEHRTFTEPPLAHDVVVDADFLGDGQKDARAQRQHCGPSSGHPGQCQPMGEIEARKNPGELSELRQRKFDLVHSPTRCARTPAGPGDSEAGQSPGRPTTYQLFSKPLSGIHRVPVPSLRWPLERARVPPCGPPGPGVLRFPARPSAVSAPRARWWPHRSRNNCRPPVRNSRPRGRSLRSEPRRRRRRARCPTKQSRASCAPCRTRIGAPSACSRRSTT